LAAIPALLGFVPANSVVMIARTGSPATFAFVARTDVIGSGPVAAAGLDQIEAAQRELDSMGIRSIRTLVGIRSIRTLVAESLEVGAGWFDTNGEVPDQQCMFCVSCQ
jgi:inactivated superfamily I helicase